jgi:hypothetical protein
MKSMKLLTAACAAIACILPLARTAQAQEAEYFLTNRQYLFPGQRLVGNAARCTLEMQGDGNLVMYCSGVARWHTNTVGKGGYAAMQGDGNFVLYDWYDRPVWASNTAGHTGALLIQVDSPYGYLEVRKGSDSYWWTGAHFTGSTVTPRRGIKTFIRGNTDRIGDDYAEVPLAQSRSSWCAFYCSQDSVCKAFTYVSPGIQDSRSHCYLKDQIPAESAATGMVSGRIIRY